MNTRKKVVSYSQKGRCFYRRTSMWDFLQKVNPVELPITYINIYISDMYIDIDDDEGESSYDDPFIDTDFTLPPPSNTPGTDSSISDDVESTSAATTNTVVPEPLCESGYLLG